MTEDDWTAFEQQGLARYWIDQNERRAGGERIPALVASRLPCLDDAGIEDLRRWLCDEQWPLLIERAAGATGKGWPEIVAGTAAAATLVCGATPDPISVVLDRFPGASERLRAAVLPFARYALRVGAEGRLSRLFIGSAADVDVRESPLGVTPEIERALAHCISPRESFDGRSHTALLALMALERRGQLVMPIDRPVAATGEISRADGETIEPVDGLVEKKRAFFRAHPDGVLLSAPPRMPAAVDEEQEAFLRSLFRAGHKEEEYGTNEDWKRRNRLGNRDLALGGGWIVAGSLEEARAKLASVVGATSEAERHGDGVLESWDGRRLGEGQILPLRMDVRHGFREQPTTRVLDEDTLFDLVLSIRDGVARISEEQWRFHLAGPPSDDGEKPRPATTSASPRIDPDESSEVALDKLESQMMERLVAPPAEPRPTHTVRGAVVYGGPGSGKSIFARSLARRFHAGPLGVLGMVFVVRARDLADDLERHPARMTLAERLISLRPSAHHLLRALIAQRRLFLILDGLDEVRAEPLGRIGRLLSESEVGFLATTRAAHHPLGAFPPFYRYSIASLTESEAAALARLEGRADLAAQIEQQRFARSGTRTGPIDALCNTPFAVSLLTRIVREGELLAALRLDELYHRAFVLMVERGVARGLRPEEADVLRRIAPTMLGELALGWLASGDSYISDAALEARLEQAGIRGEAIAQYQLALERGNLLVPGAGQREFAHRTIAEWMAGRALQLRAEREAQRAPRPEEVDRAAIEARECTILFASGQPVGSSRWRQVALFCAPWLRAPLPMLHRIVAQRGRHDEHVAFALEFAAVARWTTREPARAAWVLLIGAVDHRPEAGDAWNYQARQALPTGFLDQVATFLPDTLTELVALAASARSSPHVTRSDSDPTDLLPCCPRSAIALFEPFLLLGTTAQKVRVLAHFRVAGVRIPGAWLQETSRQVVALLADCAKEKEGLPRAVLRFDEHGRMLLDEDDRARKRLEDHENTLRQLEREIFTTALQQGDLLPTAVLVDRLAERPWHLTEQLRELPACLCSDEAAGVLQDAILLALTRAARLDAKVRAEVGAIAARDDRDDVAIALDTEVWRHDEVSRHGRGSSGRFASEASRLGWKVPERYSRSGRPTGYDVDALYAVLERAGDAGSALRELLRIVASHAGRDALAEHLFDCLPAGTPERGTLVEGFLSVGWIPAAIHVREVLSFIETDNRYSVQSNLGPEGPFGTVHDAEWRELAQQGRGRDRFIALLWLARGRDSEAAVLGPHVGGEDAVLSELARLRIEENHRFGDASHATGNLSPGALATLSLEVRSNERAEGWIADLVRALEDVSPSNGDELSRLCALAGKHGVAEAAEALWSLLQRRSGRFAEHCIVGALIAVTPQPDRRLVARLLPLLEGSLPPALVPLVDAELLGALLARPEAPYEKEPLVAQLIGLGEIAGPVLRRRIRELVREEQRLMVRLKEIEREREREAERTVRESIHGTGAIDRARTVDLWHERMANSDAQSRGRRWQELLGAALIGIEARPERSVAELVDLVFVYDTGGVERRFEEAVRRRLTTHPAESESLIRLCSHPRSSMRRLGWQLLEDCTPAADRPEALVAAIEAEVAGGSPRDTWSASDEGGGKRRQREFHRRWDREILDRVERSLTALHRPLIESLLSHPIAALRIIAIDAVRRIGAPEWLPLLLPRLSDENAEVVTLALMTFETIARPSDYPSLVGLSRDRWGLEHYDACVSWVLAQRKRSPLTREERDIPRPVIVTDDVAFLAAIAREAAVSFESEQEPHAGNHDAEADFDRWERWSQLAQALDRLDKGALTDEQLRAMALRPSEFERRAALLLLTDRGALASDGHDRLLGSTEHVDRLLGAECCLISGCSHHVEAVQSTWDEELRPSTTEPPPRRSGYHWRGIPQRRLAFAIRRAHEAHVQLLVMLVDALDSLASQDEDGDVSLNEVGARCARTIPVMVRRWGPPARAALLDWLRGEPSSIAEWEVSRALGIRDEHWDGMTEEIQERAVSDEPAASLLDDASAPPSASED